MKRRGNKRQYIGVICLVMVISLSAVGVGFGAWQEGMQVRGVVATGNIDPVFSRCVVAGESCSPSRAMVNLEGNGKSLGLQVDDAHTVQIAGNDAAGVVNLYYDYLILYKGVCQYVEKNGAFYTGGAGSPVNSAGRVFHLARRCAD